MATISVKKAKTGKPGKPKIRGWQINFNRDDATRNGWKSSIFLSANLYPEEIAQDCRLLACALEKAARIGADVPDDAAKRIEGRPDFKRKLIAAGVLDESADATLGVLWERYWEESVSQWKPTTETNVQTSRLAFFRFFDVERRANDLTETDAAAFERFLLERGQTSGAPYAQASKAGVVKTTRAVFRWGVRRGYLTRNVFEATKAGSMTNEERWRYVDEDAFRAMLAAAPTQERRALLALYRCCGLRKTEPLGLRWGDVDFERGWVTVASPKTERYRGKEKRRCPLFRVVRRELEALKAERERQGIADERVILQDRNENTLPNKFRRIVIDAGLPEYPAFFQNLRRSAATDIARRHGAKVESLWVGHGERVSFDHYQLETTDDHRRALADAFGVDASDEPAVA